jgi:hypothetical protein
VTSMRAIGLRKRPFERYLIVGLEMFNLLHKVNCKASHLSHKLPTTFCQKAFLSPTETLFCSEFRHTFERIGGAEKMDILRPHKSCSFKSFKLCQILLFRSHNSDRQHRTGNFRLDQLPGRMKSGPTRLLWSISDPTAAQGKGGLRAILNNDPYSFSIWAWHGLADFAVKMTVRMCQSPKMGDDERSANK